MRVLTAVAGRAGTSHPRILFLTAVCPACLRPPRPLIITLSLSWSEIQAAPIPQNGEIAGAGAVP